MDSSPASPPSTPGQQVAALQGAFYVATGVWPILHLRSFEWVTGPKREGWLVKTVGWLITVAGATLLEGARRRAVSPELAWLGVGCAAGLAVVDTVYVLRGRIAPVYLLDAVAEAGLLAGWARSLRRLPAGTPAPSL